MNHCSLTLWCTLLFFICPPCWCLLAQDDSGRPQKRLFEIFEAPIINSEAWLNGDLLAEETLTIDDVRYDGHGDPMGGVLIVQKKISRVAFDLENKRYAVFRLIDANITDFDNLDSGEARKEDLRYWHAGCVDLNEGVFTYNGSSTGIQEGNFDQRKTSIDQFTALRFEDYRSCWSTNSASEKGFQSAALTAKSYKHARWRKTGQGSGVVSFTTLGTSNFADQGIVGPWITYRFDETSLMPIFHHRYYREDAEGPKVNERTIRISWEERDGIYFPIRIINAKDKELIPGEYEFRYGERLTRIHWFRTNVADEQREDFNQIFDVENVRDREKVWALIDPERSGASSLLKPMPE